jgi:hypothetical protein
MFAEAEYTTMSIHHSFLNRGKGCGGWSLLALSWH